jgi:hypothetical protein
MTAARSCASCGADLPGDVRWCLRCYAPVRELTPRAPVWADGEFVDTPIVAKGHVPHWSRWERSETTFGPAGRIAITVGALLWLTGAVAQSPITTVFVLPLAVLIIRSVWRPGWVVPPEQAAVRPPTPRAPVSTWLWDRSELVTTIAMAAFWGCAIAVLLYVEDPLARFVVVVSGTVALGAWAYRKIEGGR